MVIGGKGAGAQLREEDKKRKKWSDWEKAVNISPSATHNSQLREKGGYWKKTINIPPLPCGAQHRFPRISW
jgi:hypothetical protein